MNTIAEDNFERYFTEKIWEMIPAIYRHEDGLAEQPDVLRSFVKILASQAAIVRRSQDRLWEDQFIEFCSDWAVSYIADLVGTRLLPEENKRGRRVDVAKTIYYRRRKGTLRILEELINDITGWEGKIVENFRRLGRFRHGLDPYPMPLKGRHSHTPPGGLANLRNQYATELVGSPFQEFHYTPDVRKHQGINGRYNINKLAFHLYRIQSYEVEDVTPFVSTSNPERFTFDPSGRDIALFATRNRRDDENWEEWTSALEWEVPVPIRCRLLGHTTFQISESDIISIETNIGIPASTSTELRTLRGWQFYNESQLIKTLSQILTIPLLPGQLIALFEASISEACGKKALIPKSISITKRSDNSLIYRLAEISTGNLHNWTINPPAEKKLIIDSEKGRFTYTNGASIPILEDHIYNYHYGFSGNIGAGTYDRRTVEDSTPNIILSGGGPISSLPNNGIIEIGGIVSVGDRSDSNTYSPITDKNPIQNLTIQSANQERPFLKITKNWILTASTAVNVEPILVLDGLWISGEAGKNLKIRLKGAYECVLIKNCTIDPGGGTTIDGDIIHPITLVVEGRVEKMIICSSIMGPILAKKNGTEGVIEELIIEDSIVQSVDDTVDAISTDQGTIEMNRVTVFGQVNVHRLFASEVLFTDKSTVTDSQNGCFRFSVGYTGSRLSKPYESHLLIDSDYWFTSKKFGHYGYGQISEIAPKVLHNGAENKSEVGAFNTLMNPIKLDSLKKKVEEYMPFGLIPIFINET